MINARTGCANPRLRKKPPNMATLSRRRTVIRITRVSRDPADPLREPPRPSTMDFDSGWLINSANGSRGITLNRISEQIQRQLPLTPREERLKLINRWDFLTNDGRQSSTYLLNTFGGKGAGYAKCTASLNGKYISLKVYKI